MYVQFEWDENNRDKPLAHGVSLDEVELAMLDPHAFALPSRLEGGELRHSLVGLASTTGRVIVAVYVARPQGNRRVATAYPARPRLTREYRERNPQL